MNIVVDTNIVFSAIISDKGKIGELLLNKPDSLRFLSPVFLLRELNKHMEKILHLTGYSEAEYQQIKTLITRHIEFIAPDKIKNEYWEISYQLLKDIDEDDTSFMALNLETNGFLWTGDKKLINGLERKNYHKTITTDILYTKYFGS